MTSGDKMITLSEAFLSTKIPSPVTNPSITFTILLPSPFVGKLLFTIAKVLIFPGTKISAGFNT